MNKTTVWVTEFADRPHYQLQWIDPITGRKRTKSSRVKRTGRERERKAADRAAAALEEKLRAGSSEAGKISWEAFRLRYEAQALTALAPNTAAKVQTVFNAVERILPNVGKGKLLDLTSERILHFQNALRQQGRAEDTIAGHTAHLRAALRWSVEQGMLPSMPTIKRPKRAKRIRGSSPMKGRPITGEEFDRMLHAVPAVVLADRDEAMELSLDEKAADERAVEIWRYYLRGLWCSGLRLEESLNLYWDRPDKLCIDLSGRHGMLRIPAELEKGHQDRLLALAPEFVELLCETSVERRKGRVFPLYSRRVPGAALTKDRVSRIVCRIGEVAGVKVQTKTVRAGGRSIQRTKCASAHDLRRSFGERWAMRVMPAVLQELMRHENIQTTMRYYVGRNAERTAEAVWDAFQGRNGNSRGNNATPVVVK